MGGWSALDGDEAEAVRAALFDLGLKAEVLRPDAEYAPALPGDTYPVYRKCANGGNCTRPGVCTCEKGWGGVDCTQPLCLQRCLNGGFCVAPDTCQCSTLPTRFLDARGIPLYGREGGKAAWTGWTGYDCGTPICVQGTWVPNVPPGTNASGGLVATLPALSALLPGLSITNDGTAWQGGCPLSTGGGGGGAAAAPTPSGYYNWSAVAGNAALGRRAGAQLCGVQVWTQGEYGNSWDNGDLYGGSGSGGGGGADGAQFGGLSVSAPGRVPRVNYYNISAAVLADGGTVWSTGRGVAGEGLFTCANGGACVGPDACLCDAGFSGYDCSVPLCLNVSYNTAVPSPLTPALAAARGNCFNGALCTAPERCTCVTLPALLPGVHPLDLAPGQMTGYASVTVGGGWAWVGLSLPLPTPPDTPYSNQASFAAQTLTPVGLPLAARDCSMPICTQGWYNATGCLRTPVVNDSSVTSQDTTVPCFQCANGGTCV